jgi:hypothetical protein
MPREAESKTGEFLQIIIMACFFTAALFAIVTLAFVLKVNPDKQAEAENQAKEYEELKKLLGDSQMKLLRQQAKKSEEGDKTKDLRQIILDDMAAHGLEYSSMPQPGTKTKAGLTEMTQSIVLKPASLVKILMFIADVKEAKKSISVATVMCKPETRQESSDSWSATIEFVDYVAQ